MDLGQSAFHYHHIEGSSRYRHDLELVCRLFLGDDAFECHFSQDNVELGNGEIVLLEVTVSMLA